MRCPLCRHIAFKDVPTCPNCGGALTSRTDEPKLSLSTSEDKLGPLADFSLRPPTDSPRPAAVVSRVRRGSVRRGRGLNRVPTVSVGQRGLSWTVEGSGRESGALAIRKTLIRPRSRTREPGGVISEPAFSFESREADVGVHGGGRDIIEEAGFRTVGMLRDRLASAFLDTFLLILVDLGVVYLTARMAGVFLGGLEQLLTLPFLMFLLLLNGGYAVVLTVVGGQTVGKMVVGLRVVSADGSPVGLGRALLRTGACSLSVLPVGLGWSGVLFGKGRAFHDVLADTRVVKVP